MGTDWKLLKTQYEIGGASVKELVASHHVGSTLIELAIKEGDWKRISPDQADLEGAQERTRAMDVLHQETLVPKFIMLQAQMLDKCEDLLKEVKTLDDAGYLKIVSEVIEKHRPSIMSVKKEDANDGAITVKVLTQIGAGEQPSVSAVEISSTAGKSNGIGAVSHN